MTNLPTPHVFETDVTVADEDIRRLSDMADVLNFARDHAGRTAAGMIFDAMFDAESLSYDFYHVTAELANSKYAAEIDGAPARVSFSILDAQGDEFAGRLHTDAVPALSDDEYSHVDSDGDPVWYCYEFYPFYGRRVGENTYAISVLHDDNGPLSDELPHTSKKIVESTPGDEVPLMTVNNLNKYVAFIRLAHAAAQVQA